MQRAKKSFRFQDGREIEVLESTIDAAGVRISIEEEARADRARLNGSGDPVLLYFKEAFYSSLFALSNGSVPSLEEAASLPDRDLDEWYLHIIELNPSLFIEADRRSEGEMIFRDGSKLRIVSSFLPSSVMRRVRLETEALKKEPDPDNPKDVFAVYLYPVLASCSRGELPSIDVIRREWPEAEIYRWRDAVDLVNHHLFATEEEVSAQQKEDRIAEDKKKQKPRRSSPAI